MKKLFILTLLANSIYSGATAQGFKGLLDKATKKDSTGKNTLEKTIGTRLPGSSSGKGLNNDDIISGLKEALRVGTDSSSKKLSKLDGFFGDAAIKILMPPEARVILNCPYFKIIIHVYFIY